MKTRWLIFSLALNVVLAGAMLWAAHRREAADSAHSIWRYVTNRPVRVRHTVIEQPPRVVEVAAPFQWSEVESSDYRVYLANLRGIGCPEGVIRDIVVADVDAMFIERLRELMRPLHASLWEILADLKAAEKQGDQYEKSWRALKDEREKVFEELFGSSNPFEPEELAEREAGEQLRQSEQLDFLSVEKRKALMALLKAHEDARQKIWATDHPLSNDERSERDKAERKLEADRDQQLSALLSPEELAEYRLRQTSGAGMRFRLTAVEFSADELRAIARLTNERESAEQSVHGNAANAQAKREEIQARTDAQMKEALGDARFAEFQRASDYRYGQITKVTERFGLAEETALAAYEMQRTASAQAKKIQSANDIPAEQRKALLEAIRDETQRSIRDALGARAFSAYERHGGDWMAAMASTER